MECRLLQGKRGDTKMQVIDGNFVFNGELDGVDTIGFSENEEGDGKYLLVQWKDRYDDQDMSLGQNRPYIEVGGQEMSQYGGVEGIYFDGKELNIIFLPATRLGVKIGTIVVRVLVCDGNVSAARRLVDLFSR